MNRSIKDALVAEEKFFRSRPVRKLLCIVVFKPFDLYIIYTDAYPFAIHRYTVVYQIVVVYLN
jgi:hypothetical protein